MINAFQRRDMVCAVLACVVLGPSLTQAQSGRENDLDPLQWLEVSNNVPVDRQMPGMASRTVSFETTEGTFINVDVSPDGSRLAFDLLGDIYGLPIVGGQAVPLTTGRSWDQAPLFSPDGDFIYFVSDRNGAKNIWRLTLSDGSTNQVTASESDIVGALNWSQERSRLIAGMRDPKNGGLDTTPRSIDPFAGTIETLFAPKGPAFDYAASDLIRPIMKIYSAVQAADGELYFDEAQFDPALDRMSVRMYVLDRNGEKPIAITPSDAPYSEYKPQLSHDGKLLAYFRQYNDRQTEMRILDRRTAEDTALIELGEADDASNGSFQDTRPNYAFTPDDRHLVFWHGGKIHRVGIADGSREIIQFRVNVERRVWERALPEVQHFSETGEASVIRWPSMSRDGRRMAFAAVGYVWILDLTTGELRRLTASNDFEYMPDISPDGRSVAYISFSHTGDVDGNGRLMVTEVDNGTPRDLLAEPNASYLLPNWSADGQKIAAIREYESESGLEATFGWTPSTRGVFTEVAESPATDIFLSAPIYARYVGFDQEGQNLLFSYPVSQTEIRLAAANLDGSDRRKLAVGSPEVGGIAPAPDLKKLALTRRNGTVWVVPFNASADSTEVSTFASHARRVSAGGGYYVRWNNPSQITFGFGKDVFRFRLNRQTLKSLHVSVPLKEPGGRSPIVFAGARLITMVGECATQVIQPGTVVVRGRRIAAIGPDSAVQIPAEALVIDVTGKTIMPGLIDTHYHRIGGSGGAIGMSGFKLPNPRFGDRTAIAYGITTAWEPGGPWNDGVPAMVDLQRAGRIKGPRWSHSAMGTVGYPVENLASYGDALAAVKQHEALGVVVLKEASTPQRRQRQWLSVAAHERGLGIVSHTDNFEEMMTRVVDGFTGGEHSYIPVPFFKDVRELLRQTGYIWTPNIVISGGSIAGSADVEVYFWENILKRRPRQLDKRRAMTSTDRVGRVANVNPSVPFDIHRVSRVAKQVASAAQNGINISLSGHNMPGTRLHMEMWYLSKGDLPTEDVLRAATIGNAKKLGLQAEIGSLQVGKIADLLVLGDNPLEDITNTLSIEYTVQGGVVYDSATGQKADLALMQRVAASRFQH